MMIYRCDDVRAGARCWLLLLLLLLLLQGAVSVICLQPVEENDLIAIQPPCRPVTLVCDLSLP